GRVLGPADFNLFASNVFASVSFNGTGLLMALTNGVLRLPDRFTTLAAGECSQDTSLPNAGTVPSVALAPGSALTLDHAFGQSATTATLRLTGGIDFANFGVAVPASPGQPTPAALKLCSGRLVFRGSDLPALENLSGKIRVNNLGFFSLVNGSLDPRGAFSVQANGQATVNGVTFNLVNFQSSYAANQFSLSAASSLDLGDGVRLEPDDISDPSHPAPPVISAAFNAQTQAYELAVAGKLQLPGAQYIAMRGQISNGRFSLSSQGQLKLGADILFRPVTQNGNTLPVLQLESVVVGGASHAQLALAGELLVPGADSQPHPLSMAGRLRFRATANGGTEVDSLNVVAAVPSFDFGAGVRLAAVPDPADATKSLPVASLNYDRQAGYQITFAGQLLAPGIVQRAQLSGRIQNSQLVLASVGLADFGNNFKITPLLDGSGAELPALQLEIVTSGAAAKARFNLSGNVQVPGANGVARQVQIAGSLALTVAANGVVKVESFSAKAATTTLDLGNGLKLDALADPDNAATRLPIISGVYGDQSGYEIKVAGRLVLSGAGTPTPQSVELRGRVNNNLLELNSTVRAHLGNGVWIEPDGNQAVLQLLATQGQQTDVQFKVGGLFRVPGEAGDTRSVAVTGSLHLGLAGNAPQIKSLAASSATTNDWAMPGGMHLQQAGVSLEYATNRFLASLSGQIQVGPKIATLDHGTFIFEDENDSANIRLDAQVTLQNVALGEIAYLVVGSTRLELATTLTGIRPRGAFGRLSVGGGAGLFPTGPVPVEPVRTNFILFVENVGLKAEFTPTNISFVLTNGALHLPEMFTSGQTNLCPDSGAGPVVALGSNTTIRVTFTPETRDVDLAANGTLQFGNLGF
ncbi:MAG TPA: hypothetical protein VHH73_17505, partial [Verrucomicrobiae bacterium]|nr:hypothetical protein [Verrucomicrobiae bacterium]